jgi:L-cysteine:1D-myo-inositol 2-amino-2-deoxy-alpha-D-glucopyranoside ligase
MIGLDGEKMSKSKGNLVFVSTLVRDGRDPMAIRWALMKDHYRTDRMWTDELLVSAESELAALRSALTQLNVAPTQELIEKMIAALADDLDTFAVTSMINEWAQKTQSGDTGGDAQSLVTALDALLGVTL